MGTVWAQHGAFPSRREATTIAVFSVYGGKVAEKIDRTIVLKCCKIDRGCTWPTLGGAQVSHGPFFAICFIKAPSATLKVKNEVFTVDPSPFPKIVTLRRTIVEHRTHLGEQRGFYDVYKRLRA